MGGSVSSFVQVPGRHIRTPCSPFLLWAFLGFRVCPKSGVSLDRGPLKLRRVVHLVLSLLLLLSNLISPDGQPRISAQTTQSTQVERPVRPCPPCSRYNPRLTPLALPRRSDRSYTSSHYPASSALSPSSSAHSLRNRSTPSRRQPSKSSLSSRPSSPSSGLLASSPVGRLINYLSTVGRLSLVLPVLLLAVGVSKWACGLGSHSGAFETSSGFLPWTGYVVVPLSTRTDSLSTLHSLRWRQDSRTRQCTATLKPSATGSRSRAICPWVSGTGTICPTGAWTVRFGRSFFSSSSCGRLVEELTSQGLLDDSRTPLARSSQTHP